MPNEVHIFFAILNTVLCAVLIVVRVHHQKKKKKNKILNLVLLCMLFGFLSCLGILSTELYFADTQHCRLSLKLNGAAYSLHRVLLYTFIILRLEVVNQSGIMNRKIIVVGKVVIGVIGTFIVLTSTLSTKGITMDQHPKCMFKMNNGLLVTLFVIDAVICAGGTWVFVRPLRLTSRHIESEIIRYLVKRTRIWSIVSLMATLTSMLTVAVFDGFTGVFAFDCSITSFSLVMMMSPVKPRLISKIYSNSYSNSRQKAEMSSASQIKQSSGEEP